MACKMIFGVVLRHGLLHLVGSTSCSAGRV
jgi:hypothetical protein